MEYTVKNSNEIQINVSQVFLVFFYFEQLLIHIKYNT